MRQATVEKVRVPATHHATSQVAMVWRRGWVIHHHREGIEGGVGGEMLSTERSEGEGEGENVKK